MQRLPEELITKEAPDATADVFVANPVLRRYGEICAGFLKRKESISVPVITAVIQQRASALNVRRRPGVRDRHLDQLAIKVADRRWLQAHFPSVLTQGSASSLCRTYSDDGLAYAASYYALALAVLFDSADEALVTLERGERVSEAAANCPGVSSDEERAIASFIADLPWMQVAELHGLPIEGMEDLLRSTLRQAIRGVVMRSNAPFLAQGLGV